MVKKQIAAKFEPIFFDDIPRGTSFTLPILVRKSDDTPFDLTGFKAIFTLKAQQSDHDYDDDRALITKEFEPYTDDPNKVGRIDIQLTSKDLWLDPGQYYFDVVLMKGYSSARILLATTTIVGGPTNHNVRHEDQDGFILHDPIKVTPSKGQYIAVQVPFIVDPPENIVEGAAGDPQYTVQNLDDPARHVLIRNYGPRVSLMMTLRVPHDHTNHRYRFDEFFLNGNIPAPCPLKNGFILFNHRKFELHLAKEMDMVYRWTCIQHNPELTYDGGMKLQKASEPIYIGDRVQSGSLVIQLLSDNDQIHMTAEHFIPDDHGDFEMWMIRVDWFNWVDPYEPDPEREDVSTHFPNNPTPDSWGGYWPPDMWYCLDGG